MKNNRYQGRNLVGKRVTLKDGRHGVCTSAGYGLASVDLDEGHWWCGPVKEVRDAKAS